MECVHATTDSIPYVHRKNNTRQVVVLGASNENEVIIEQGLEFGDQIYLSSPEDGDEFKWQGDELREVIKQKARDRREEANKASEQVNKKPGGSRMMTPEMKEKFDNMSEEEKKEMASKMREGGGMRQGGRQGGQTSTRN